MFVPGQKAVINRQTIVTIDKVTPSGIIKADGRTWNEDGYERGAKTSRSRTLNRLEVLTPEIQAEMDLIEIGKKITADTFKAMALAESWLRQNLGSWSRKVPDVADVDKAERLIAAIKDILGDA